MADRQASRPRHAPAHDATSDFSARRRALVPAATLPLAYFAAAHLALAVALLALVADPHLPAVFDGRPRLIALVHLMTLGWISGSILGALYIVGPLALDVPLPGTKADVVACLSFWMGTFGMAAGFWTNQFHTVGTASVFVLGAIVFVGVRTMRGLSGSRVPRGVALHLGFAFANAALAWLAGLLLAQSHLRGGLPWSSLSLAVAHAHLAVLGWAIMMIFGVAYRLLPMMVPTAMPTGSTLAVSAVLLQAGTLGLSVSLAAGWDVRLWAIIVLAAFASFFTQVRRMLRMRRRRAVELPSPDWSTGHTGLALLYGLVTAGLGAWLAFGSAPPAVSWVYGAAGLLGFVSQMVVGIQSRLLPLHAWFRAMVQSEGVPPVRSSHALVDSRLALTVFLLWLPGLPLLIAGIAGRQANLVATGAALLLGATLANAWHGRTMIERARSVPGAIGHAPLEPRAPAR